MATANTSQCFPVTIGYCQDTHTYIHIHVCVCACALVGVNVRARDFGVAFILKIWWSWIFADDIINFIELILSNVMTWKKKKKKNKLWPEIDSH